MAKIPRLESTRQFSGRPVSVGIRPSQTGKDISFLGQTIAKVSQQFLQAQTTHEITKADTEARRRLGELELEAVNTPDVFDINQFNQKREKIREEVSKGITLPSAREQFQSQFSRLSLSSDFNIRTTLRKRQIDAMKTSMLENIDALQDSETREAELDLLLKKNIGNLVISKEKAFKLKKATLKDWEEKDVRNAIAINADVAKQALTDGEFDFTTDETAKWIQVAEKKIKRNEKEVQKTRDTKWLVNLGKIGEDMNKVSTEDLIQMMANDEIDPQIGNDLIAWKTDPKTVDNEVDKEIWKEIVRDSMNPEQDLRKFQATMAKALKEGNIKSKDYANLTVHTNNLFQSAINFKSQDSAFMKAMRTAMDVIRINILPIPGFFAIKELIKKVQAGIKDEDIVPAAKEIINKNTVENNPQLTGFSEKGQLMIDAFGNKALVFPDGRIEEIE